MVAGNRVVLCDYATLVYRGAASESDVLPGVFPAAQSGAVCDEPVPAPAAFVVLPGGSDSGSDAVDGNRSAGIYRWSADIGGRVAVAEIKPEAESSQPAGRCVPGVSGVVGDHSGCVLFVFSVEAAWVHSSVDSADYDSDR